MTKNIFQLKETELSNALIYFPYISSFTKFVSHAEIKHSQVIYIELLETIVEHNAPYQTTALQNYGITASAVSNTIN